MTRSQSLRNGEVSTTVTGPCGSVLTASISDLAEMDASHKRRSLKLSCGGGLLLPPSAAATRTTATVDFSTSCPATPTSVTGCSVTFSVPSAAAAAAASPGADISVQVNVNMSVVGPAAAGEETSRRYRYPFQPLVVGRTSPSPPPPPQGVSSGGVAVANKHRGTSPEDIECIAATQAKLRLSGFYYEGITWLEAIDLLTNKPEGTFLVRDSQVR